MAPVGFGLAFFSFFLILPIIAVASVGFGIAALVSISRTPVEGFGPWWDNTRQTWLIGVVVSFVIPLGNLIAGIMWFTTGRGPLRNGTGYAGRPFWSGPPKPPPPPGWSPYGVPPGYGAPPPQPAQPAQPAAYGPPPAWPPAQPPAEPDEKGEKREP